MLTFEVTPGKTFEAGEKCTNDKLNLLGQPSIEVDGGLEFSQMQADSTFVAWDNGTSVVNVYKAQYFEPEQDPSALVDAMIVAFKIPAGLTNTGASTFELKKSDGTLLGTLAIKKRGRDVIAGDLVEHHTYSFRYDSVANVWQLGDDTGLVEGADIVPSPVWWGVNNGSTGTAYVMKFTPAPIALASGLRVAFVAPVTSGTSPTLQIQDGAGTNIGAVKSLNRAVSLGISAGELPAGMVIEAIYDGTVWSVQTPLMPSAVSALSSGLVLVNNVGSPTTKIDVSADELAVACSPGRSVRVISAISLTIDTAAGVGPNGLDAALSGTALWYYVWVIFNPSTATVAGLLSQSRTAPTLTDPSLSGFTHRALVGAAHWNGAGFFTFYQTGRQVFLTRQTVFSGKQATASDTWQALAGGEVTAFQGVVPPNARLVLGFAGQSTNGADASNAIAIAVAADANGMGEQRIHGIGLNGANPWTVGGVGTFGAGNYRVPMVAATYGLYWKSYSNGAAQLSFLCVTGFEL